MVANRTELDLSGFTIILLAQNQVCSDDKQDSSGYLSMHITQGESHEQLCVSILVLLYIVGFSDMGDWRGVNGE